MTSGDKCYEEQLSKVKEYIDGEGTSIWYKVVREDLPGKVTFSWLFCFFN